MVLRSVSNFVNSKDKKEWEARMVECMGVGVEGIVTIETINMIHEQALREIIQTSKTVCQEHFTNFNNISKSV